jgi:hypothetical protein
MPKKYAFFFHYNKPASRAAGKTVLSLHWRGVCHMVSNITCDVPTLGRHRKTQPRWVLTGRASQLRIVDGHAHIGNE